MNNKTNPEQLRKKETKIYFKKTTHTNPFIFTIAFILMFVYLLNMAFIDQYKKQAYYASYAQTYPITLLFDSTLYPVISQILSRAPPLPSISVINDDLLIPLKFINYYRPDSLLNKTWLWLIPQDTKNKKSFPQPKKINEGVLILFSPDLNQAVKINFKHASIPTTALLKPSFHKNKNGQFILQVTYQNFWQTLRQNKSSSLIILILIIITAWFFGRILIWINSGLQFIYYKKYWLKPLGANYWDTIKTENLEKTKRLFNSHKIYAILMPAKKIIIYIT